MRQEAEKTIVAKIRTDELTQIKKEALDDEFSEFQAYIRGDDADLYSATKQAADAHIDTDNLRDDHEYPWFIRNDVFDVEQHDTELADWWMNIPVSQVYGGVNVPINPHESIPDDAEMKDSKIVKEDGEYYAHLSIKQRVELQDEYDGVLAIDLGSRWVAVSVALPSRETMFYGNCADIIRNFALDSKRRERTIRSCPSRIASGVRLTTDSTRLADRLLKTLRSGIFSSSLVTSKASRIRRWGLRWTVDCTRCLTTR